MKKNYIQFLFVLVIFADAGFVEAQTDRVTFNGVGRSLIQNDRLGASDTLHANKSNTGYTLVDEAINVKPNSSTEIQAIARFRNEYGGFYGNGAGVTFRQLWIKGTINDHLKYQFGDINLSLTKYTLFNSYADGAINEAAAISMLTNINYYENFNFGNTWRQQGAFAEWNYALEKKAMEAVTVNGFITRNRASDFSSLPELLFGGGSVQLKQSKYLSVGGNFVSLFSLAKTINNPAVKDYQNRVLTGNFKLNNSDSANVGLYFKGETGLSNLAIENPTMAGSKNDYFYEVNVGTQLKKQHLDLELGFRNVGPDFFSAGAQTKRVNFTGNNGINTMPGLFPKVTNMDYVRPVTIFDITRDRTVYNQIMLGKLMNTDLSLISLSNVLPYGAATPNRTGLTLTAAYSDSAKIWDLGVDVSFLKEIRGEGTPLLRNFMQLKAKGDIFFNKLSGWEKIMKLTFGIQYENTARKGADTSNLEKINLNSNIYDLGLELEVLKNFDVLLGTKYVKTTGNEFGKKLDDLNRVTDFVKYDNISITQSLIAAGVRYRFNPNTNLSMQIQKFNYEDSSVANYSYDFRQIFILFNMKF
jgi:hypothetical protein